MHIHQPLGRYMHICIWSKKNFVRGAFRGIYFYISPFQNLSPEGGQIMAYTCIHMSYILHKSNKNTNLTQPSGRLQGICVIFTSHFEDVSSSGLPTSQAPSRTAQTILWCMTGPRGTQLRCKNDKIPCIHPLEYFLYHFQLTRGRSNLCTKFL